MEFCEKFSALLTLTAVKSISLAKAINIDTAQISRLKTGAREMPHNTALLQDIADYLAGHFDSEYKISGLFELTGDMRLHSHFDEKIMSEIIFTWMTSVDQPTASKQISRFLNQINSFSTAEPALAQKSVKVSPFEKSNILNYRKNTGKRDAARAFFNYLLDGIEPCTIYIFSDETDDWLLEEESSIQELSDGIRVLTQKGFKFVRVQPPAKNLESSFRDLDRWLSAYMAGALRMFFYPWARDELHRRTILVAPEVIAFYSASLYGLTESEMIFVTIDKNMTLSFNSYLNDIIRRCRSMMTAYTSTEREKVLEQIEGISKIKDTGIYKSHCLSAHTIPIQALNSMRKRCNQYVKNTLDTYEKMIKHKEEVLREYTIIDMISLPEPDNVINGTEPVPATVSGSTPIYYTPEEYILHLESIIRYVECYTNYQPILLNQHELENVVIYTKGYQNVILIKESDPFALFLVSEQGFAASLVSYLKTKVIEKTTYHSTEDVVTRLEKEIETIRSRM